MTYEQKVFKRIYYIERIISFIALIIFSPLLFISFICDKVAKILMLSSKKVFQYVGMFPYYKGESNWFITLWYYRKQERKRIETEKKV